MKWLRFLERTSFGLAPILLASTALAGASAGTYHDGLGPAPDVDMEVRGPRVMGDYQVRFRSGNGGWSAWRTSTPDNGTPEAGDVRAAPVTTTPNGDTIRIRNGHLAWRQPNGQWKRLKKMKTKVGKKSAGNKGTPVPKNR